MNAPVAPGHMAEQQVEWLPIGAIAPSESAMQILRRARLTEASLQGIADSIKADGILQPLTVRPLEGSNSSLVKDTMRGFAKYELVAGERRWRAALIAGLEHVPAIIRRLDDYQVVRAQLTDIQSEPLTALEEAEGYRVMRDGEQLSVEEIMKVVGKSRSWVFDRLKLLDLPADGRQALLDGKLTAYLALPVARVKPALQDKALKIALRPGMTVRELKSLLTGPGFTANLIGAGFALDDATLFEQAGPCTTCPKRIGNCTEFDPSEDDPDVCTDTECFDAKVYWFGMRQRAAIQDRGARLITGAAAKEIAPKPGVLVGYVDLDEPVGAGHAESYRAMLTRALKEGESLEPVYIEDPKTEKIRELIPTDRAKRLLKRLGLWHPAEQLGGGESDDTAAEDQQQQPGQQRRQASAAPDPQEAERIRAEQEAQRQRQQKDLEHRRAVMMAIYVKRKGAFKREDWEAIADHALSTGAGEMLSNALFGGRTVDLGKLSEAQLQNLVLLAPIAELVAWPATNPGPLWALAKRLKIDPAKFKPKEPRAPAPKKAAKPKAAKPKKARKAKK
jgi:ParB/RepB/Spo0J family partition protein